MAHMFGTFRGPNSDQRYAFIPFATFGRPSSHPTVPFKQRFDLQTKMLPGVEIVAPQENAAFESRPCHNHYILQREEGMRRLARVFAERPERILQELLIRGSQGIVWRGQ
jgi:hypothetical protein